MQSLEERKADRAKRNTENAKVAGKSDDEQSSLELKPETKSKSPAKNWNKPE